MIASIFSRCKELLADDKICVPDEAEYVLDEYLKLIHEWSQFMKLVSKKDGGRLQEVHLADSISLVPYVEKECRRHGVFLDIGSGAGFPAIPVKAILPWVRVVLVERSERRVGFLRKVVGALRLQDVDIRLADFPVGLDDVQPACITARAVEQPGRLLKALEVFMKPGSVFLCQSGSCPMLSSATFHVEQIVDAWKASGLRRGSLWLVRRNSSTNEQ